MTVKLLRKLSLHAIFLCIVAAMLGACGSSQAPATNTTTSVPNTLPATTSPVATAQAQSASTGVKTCDLGSALSSKSGSSAIIDLQNCKLADTAPMDVVWDSADYSVVGPAGACTQNNSVTVFKKQANQATYEVTVGALSSSGGDVSDDGRYMRLNLQTCTSGATAAATAGK